MALRELSSLEKFLGLNKLNKYSTQGERKVPVLQNNNGSSLVGLATISSHLVREAKRRELLGDSPQQRAVVQQWLEYRLTRLDNCSKDEVKIILRELNQHLVDKVYLAGNRITLADTLMYYGIHHIVSCLSLKNPLESHITVRPTQKITFEHVVQAVSKLQQSMEEICNTEMRNISDTIEDVHIFHGHKARRTRTPKPEKPISSLEPKTREDLLPSVIFKQALVMALDWAGYGYAALVASGGVLGYVKAGSVPSLAAGLLFGGLAGFGAYQISQNPNNIWVSLATSGTLAALMGRRFYNSRKMMPAGIVAGA
ncbi:eukaryotic translation elongation factor 1 epsilon-1, partial [Clarias magur]